MRLLAAITKPAVIRRLLTPLQLAALPPPIAPARLVQEPCAWVSAYITDGDGMFGPSTGPRCVGSAHHPFAPHGAPDGEGQMGAALSPAERDQDLNPLDTTRVARQNVLQISYSDSLTPPHPTGGDTRQYCRAGYLPLDGLSRCPHREARDGQRLHQRVRDGITRCIIPTAGRAYERPWRPTIAYIERGQGKHAKDFEIAIHDQLARLGSSGWRCRTSLSAGFSKTQRMHER